jgi:hydrogenase maturation protease
LQIEHALDLVGRSCVLFVDASLSCRAPFEVTSLQALPDASFTTHALSPQSLLQLFRELRGDEPPPATLLAIRGECFELGAPPTTAALSNLTLALAWCRRWLDRETDAAAGG